MARIYGHKFTSSFGETDDGTWMRGLQDLTPKALATGLEACIHRIDPWPPTLPEFRMLCIGMPDLQETIQNILSGNNEPLAESIRNEIGTWELQRLNYSQIEKRVKQIYPEMLNRTMQRAVENIRQDRKQISHG